MRLHFQTRPDKPPVFRMTPEGVAAATARAGNPGDVTWSVGEDLADLAWLPETTGLVTSNDVLRDPAFPRDALAERAPALRWIHVIGAGIEPLLPLDWLPPGVTLTNNSGVHVAKTTEYCTMALLMLAARMPEMVAHQRARRWAPIFTPGIAGRTLLVVGLGDMGGAAAAAAKRLGLRVVGIRRGGGGHPDADAMLPPAELHRGLAEADFVVVATPLTPETHHLLDATALAAMKPGAGLVNIGRAGVVDYAALCDALRIGRLSGAVLDVFDPEPLPADSPLWDTPNLLITPHCSSDDLDAYLPLTFDLVFENAARLHRGEPLKNRVDPGTGY